MTSMSKDVVSNETLDRLKIQAGNDRIDHINKNKEIRKRQNSNEEFLKSFKPINGVLVNNVIIDEYYKAGDNWLEKSKSMIQQEVDKRMLDFHRVLAVSDVMQREVGISVGDYIAKKAGLDWVDIRINGLDYIIFEPYAIGGFIKKEDYDKFNNGSVRSDKT